MLAQPTSRTSPATTVMTPTNAKSGRSVPVRPRNDADAAQREHFGRGEARAELGMLRQHLLRRDLDGGLRLSDRDVQAAAVR